MAKNIENIYMYIKIKNSHTHVNLYIIINVFAISDSSDCPVHYISISPRTNQL